MSSYTSPLFEWDERKRCDNLRKHGIDFENCAVVFAGPTATIVDDRFGYGEARYVTYGLLAGEVIAVAHAETVDTVRVISMRKATKREQAFYFESIQN